MWLVIVFILIFLSILGRFAFRGKSIHLFDSMPSSDDAYEVAKDFVRPTLQVQSVDFAIHDFDCSKESDSVYIVKSYFETGREKAKTSFVVKLKYTGGEVQNDHSWDLVYMQQQ
jgi:hypothetical protein